MCFYRILSPGHSARKLIFTLERPVLETHSVSHTNQQSDAESLETVIQRDDQGANPYLGNNTARLQGPLSQRQTLTVASYRHLN